LHLRPASDKGIECATSDVRFCEPEIDTPGAAWERLLQTKLVAVAEVHNAHGLLCVASDGRCFGASYIHDAFYYEGSCIDEALEHLLIGIRARPMLRPDQHTVTLYGVQFAVGDSALYRY